MPPGDRSPGFQATIGGKITLPGPGGLSGGWDTPLRPSNRVSLRAQRGFNANSPTVRRGVQFLGRLDRPFFGRARAVPLSEIFPSGEQAKEGR
jgi:hypothetical protein